MAGRGRGKALTRPAWMSDQLATTTQISPKSTTVTDWAQATASDGRPYWYSLSSGKTTWDDPSSTTKAKPKHIAPWRKNTAGDGRIYYYNEVTKQTQWYAPPGFVEIAPPPGVKGKNAGSSNGVHEPTKIPTTATRTLPAGWAENRTKDGRIYYYHPSTRETRWEFPLAAPLTGVSSGTAARKRPASEFAGHEQSNYVDIAAATGVTQRVLPLQWKECTTTDGKTYYYNTQTRETSWTNPGADSTQMVLGNTSGKRARLDAEVADLRHLVPRTPSRVQAEVGKLKSKGQVFRRPRAPDGKALTDHQAETYFLNRAKRRRESKSEGSDVDKKDDVTIAAKSGEQGQSQFQSMLRERGIALKTSWLETMSRCGNDSRYLLVEPYGKRKHEWQKFIEKLSKQQRRNAIVEERDGAQALMALMTETFVNEPFSSSSLDRCNPDAIKRFEADSRYRNIDDRKRAALIRSFFAVRQRKGERERMQKRKDAISRMRAELNKMTDPELFVLGDSPVSKTNDKSEAENTEADSATLDKGTDDVKTRYFNDRTSFRQLQEFLESIPNSNAVSSSEKVDLIRDWRRTVERLTHEKKAREREARKKLLRDRRANFRSGVEKLVLDGRIPINSRWKDVAELVEKELFALPEAELDARPVDLFKDGMELFDEKVERFRDQFKQLSKDAGIDIQETTTLEELSKNAELGKLINSVEKPVATALLVDRQRRESKRRTKELIRAQEDFDEVLRRIDISSETTYEDAVEKVKDRSSYKQLLSKAGETGVRKVFDEYIEWRRNKDHAKLKRKFESPAEVPFDHAVLAALERAKRLKLPGGPVPQYPFGAPPIHPPRQLPVIRPPAVPVPPAPPAEEENGWTAALSTKPMTEEEKREAKERRKRELLEGLNGGGSQVPVRSQSPERR